ncbi:MAG: sulfur oxidation c-type cytochrome SoxA [Gammaproteobacteria bacterium]|nr:sulfur oxidation c-type cytochrome SoxA [Gammaproteobacteria bacterium]
MTPIILHAELISGYEFISEQAKEIQNDDFQNPGFSVIENGLDIYNEVGENEVQCSNCHGLNGNKFIPKSIAQFPKFHEILDKPVTLRDQIQYCWVERLENFPLLYDDIQLLALETMIRNKAFGEKVNVDINEKMKPYYEAGKAFYFTRFGQMDMNCSQCHDIYTGQMLRGQKLSQGHTNGFPLFRLESQKMVNLPQRLRECFRSLRAETFEQNSDEFRNLEIYLNARGNGLKIETPAVRY